MLRVKLYGFLAGIKGGYRYGQVPGHLRREGGACPRGSERLVRGSMGCLSDHQHIYLGLNIVDGQIHTSSDILVSTAHLDPSILGSRSASVTTTTQFNASPCPAPSSCPLTLAFSFPFLLAFAPSRTSDRSVLRPLTKPSHVLTSPPVHSVLRASASLCSILAYSSRGLLYSIAEIRETTRLGGKAEREEEEEVCG